MRRQKKKPAGEPGILRPGDKILIRQNPHDLRAENIIGTVIVFRPGAGFAGSDLVDVHYKHPRDGRGFTLPFGLTCLASAAPADLIQLAEHYEQLAGSLRDAAGNLAASE